MLVGHLLHPRSNLLRQSRERRGWSQQVADRWQAGGRQVAEQSSGDPVTVSRWECGITIPSPHYRQRICAIFVIDIEALGLPPPAVPITGVSGALLKGGVPLKDGTLHLLRPLRPCP